MIIVLGGKLVENKNVAIYLTGGIACYKAVNVVREFVKAKANVKVAMTASAQKMITPLTLAALSQNPVYTDFEMPGQTDFVPHISLADWSDLAVVVPASANIIAKMANGLADDFVSTALLATAAPKFVIPAMNDKMLSNPATSRNIAVLKDDGVKIMEPAYGFLAEGYDGKGRMPQPEEIFSWISQQMAVKQDLKGLKVVVSAAGTIEKIDPVRYLTNFSSGKMGYALAEVAKRRGAKVVLVSGPSNLQVPVGIKYHAIKNTTQMQNIMQAEFVDADIAIMAAAVSDYRVKEPATEKIKKDTPTLTLELVKNPDILKELGQQKKSQFLVGFAAETQDVLANGGKKLIAKNLDMLVANDVARTDIGFGTKDNEVTLLTPKRQPKPLPKASKRQIAEWIFDEIIALRQERGEKLSNAMPK